MKKEEYDFIYIARIFACIAVVAIHAVSLQNALSYTNGVYEWWTHTIVVSMSIWAVPLFVMISGALLLNKKNESTKDFYKKRFIKVAIPAIFWIPCYFIFYYYTRGYSIELSDILQRIQSGSFDHLYFLVLILELYLITPVLRRVVQTISSKYLFSLILIFFVIGFVWVKINSTMFMFVPYIGYYILGYYLFKFYNPKKYVYVVPFIFLTTIVVQILLLFFFTAINDNKWIRDALLFSHNNPLITILAGCVFIFMQHSQIKLLVMRYIDKIFIKRLSNTTFGIYIIHPMVQLLTISLLQLYFNDLYISWYILLLCIPYSFIVSHFLISFLQKFTYSKALV